MALTYMYNPPSNKCVLRLAYSFNPAWNRVNASGVKGVQNMGATATLPHYSRCEEFMDKRNRMEVNKP